MQAIFLILKIVEMAKKQILVAQYFEQANAEGKRISKKTNKRKKKPKIRNSMTPEGIWEILYLLVKFCLLFYMNS